MCGRASKAGLLSDTAPLLFWCTCAPPGALPAFGMPTAQLITCVCTTLLRGAGPHKRAGEHCCSILAHYPNLDRGSACRWLNTMAAWQRVHIDALAQWPACLAVPSGRFLMAASHIVVVHQARGYAHPEPCSTGQMACSPRNDQAKDRRHGLAQRDWHGWGMGEGTRPQQPGRAMHEAHQQAKPCPEALNYMPEP